MSKLKSKGNFTEYLYYITSTWEVRLRHGDALRPCDSREGSRFSLSQPATVLPVTDFGLDKRMMALVDFCCRKLRPDYPVGAFSFVAPASSRLFVIRGSELQFILPVLFILSHELQKSSRLPRFP